MRSSTTTTSPRATRRLLTKISIGSPTFLSSSTTAPRPSFSSWLTSMLVRPSTTVICTGMSYTVSRLRLSPTAASTNVLSAVSAIHYSFAVLGVWFFWLQLLLHYSHFFCYFAHSAFAQIAHG